MKILVTGGVGFLGTNLCLRLLREGHQVIALDNFQTSLAANRTLLMQQKNFQLIEHDVTEKFPDLDADQLYNLACPASPPKYQLDPVQTMKICVLGMINALDFAAKRNIPVLQASTSEIYGDPEQHPQQEDYRGAVNTLGPRACYDEGKRAAETLCMDYHRTYGTRVKIMRIFNTYGPHMDPEDGRVVSNLICQALRGEQLTMYGDGSQTRSFCYVDDLIDGMMRLMSSADDVTGPVNIGNPGEFTILQLAQEIQKQLQTSTALAFRPLPQDDPKQRRPDIARAKELLSWQPHIALADGIARTVPWFRDLLQSNGTKVAA